MGNFPSVGAQPAYPFLPSLGGSGAKSAKTTIAFKWTRKSDGGKEIVLVLGFGELIHNKVSVTQGSSLRTRAQGADLTIAPLSITY